MITKEQCQQAPKQHDEAEGIINTYYKEERELFNQRLKEKPIFTDDELIYSATALCPCGHGLAYPKDCGPYHYWDCSAILKGIAGKDVQHTGKMPFMFYDFKNVNEIRGTTRGKM